MLNLYHVFLSVDKWTNGSKLSLFKANPTHTLISHNPPMSLADKVLSHGANISIKIIIVNLYGASSKVQ